MAIESVWSFETGVRTMWQECRGESLDGQQAVAAVIWNRLKSGRWGHSLAEVCLAPFQFSGWLATDPNRMASARVANDDPVLIHLRQVLLAAQVEKDPTGGAQFYYAKAIPEPKWVPEMTFCGQFGKQMFYKPKVQSAR